MINLISFKTVSRLVCSIAFFALNTNVDASISCEFMQNMPIVEHVLSSYHQTLKFVNVKATVYRQALTSGTTPRIKILRYSSIPMIASDSTTNEVIISTEDNSDCLKKDLSSRNPSGASRSNHWNRSNFMLMTVLAAATSSLTSGSKLVPLTALAGAVLSYNSGNSNGLLFANAQDVLEDDCTNIMEVVVEAPPYYKGSVAECLNEVEDPSHCPMEFPTYPECSDPAPECKLSVVGAGTGGLYTAMRLIDEKKFDGEDVCIFEATERVGGRIYSLRGFGPDNDITVDAGGYRTWPEFTPTTHSLITEYLGLQVECYEDETPCQKFNIVGDSGQKIGFTTFVETMMERLIDEGACFYPRHELASIRVEDSTSTTSTASVNGMNDILLEFSNGVRATTTSDVILNVPQRPLLQILRKSDIPLSKQDSKIIFDSLHSVQTEIVTKLYLYYSDAWWYKLGLTQGDFELSGDARSMLLQGRYHDGHVKCEDDSKDNCQGFLLAVYAHDFAGDKAQYFRRYQRDRPEPVTIISNTDVEGAAFLDHAHNRLREYHLYEATNASYTGYEFNQIFNRAAAPEFAVLATWNIGTYGAGGGWHHWTDLDNIDIAEKPLNDFHIHVINEAYSHLQGWAEGSLLLADDVLEEKFNVDRPWDFAAPEYVQFVQQTTAQNCVEEEEENASSGNEATTSAGDGTVDLCFAADSMIAMPDGLLRPISNITVGDEVGQASDDNQNDGNLRRTGKVTEVLVHNVNKEIEVAVILTNHGELVATLSHPIWINNIWIEIGAAIQSGAISQVQGIISFGIEMRYVDKLYNLEIDGHVDSVLISKATTTMHSYIVNGIVASGLGDNALLNQIHKRQNFWKTNDFEIMKH